LARELHSLAKDNKVDAKGLKAYSASVGLKEEIEDGKPVSSWLAIVRQGLYVKIKEWIQANRRG
jgi:hypothetical protein